MKAFFGQHADPPSWRSNLLEQTIVLGTCETHSKVYPKLNQLRVLQVRTPPILVKYLAGTNYLPWTFWGGGIDFWTPYHLKREWGVWEKSMGFSLQIDALNWWPCGKVSMLIFEIYFDATNTLQYKINYDQLRAVQNMRSGKPLQTTSRLRVFARRASNASAQDHRSGKVWSYSRTCKSLSECLCECKGSKTLECEQWFGLGVALLEFF